MEHERVNEGGHREDPRSRILKIPRDPVGRDHGTSGAVAAD